MDTGLLTVLRTLKFFNVCMKLLVAEPRDSKCHLCICRVMKVISNETRFTIFGDYVSEIR